MKKKQPLHTVLIVVVFGSASCRGSCGSAVWATLLGLWVRRVYSHSQWGGHNRRSCVTFNHASGACLMISISVENNSNKCQMQDPTQSPGRGAHNRPRESAQISSCGSVCSLNLHRTAKLKWAQSLWKDHLLSWKLDNLVNFCLSTHSKYLLVYGRKTFLK